MPTMEDKLSDQRAEISQLHEEQEKLRISLYNATVRIQSLEDENKRLVDRARAVRIGYRLALRSLTESLINALIDIDED